MELEWEYLEWADIHIAKVPTTVEHKYSYTIVIAKSDGMIGAGVINSFYIDKIINMYEKGDVQEGDYPFFSFVKLVEFQTYGDYGADVNVIKNWVESNLDISMEIWRY